MIIQDVLGVLVRNVYAVKTLNVADYTGILPVRIYVKRNAEDVRPVCLIARARNVVMMDVMASVDIVPRERPVIKENVLNTVVAVIVNVGPLHAVIPVENVQQVRSVQRMGGAVHRIVRVKNVGLMVVEVVVVSVLITMYVVMVSA